MIKVWQRSLLPVIVACVGLGGFWSWTSHGSSEEPSGQSTLNILDTAELAQGFQSVSQFEGRSELIVHPNSPCWLEIPSPRSADFTEPGPASGFVGAEACMACHKKNYATFLETPHYVASRAASLTSILGSFEKPDNQLQTNHPDLSFSMIAQADGGLYQEVHFRELSRQFRFDIVTGSGGLAQTYLFWQGNELYQMHVSYYSRLGRWINSPGFSDGTAWYARETIPKCASCHMTYMEPIPASPNGFQRAEVIFGVTCERCHGPGGEHVAHHRKFPGERQAKFVTNPSKLSRKAMNDLCAQCHHGSAEPLRPPFSFRPGDKLEEFWKVNEEPGDRGKVHSSNQLQRLTLSECFIASEMTCLDCHSPHQRQSGDMALYSRKCAACHEPESCSTALQIGLPADSNCIDCHMGMGYDDHIRMETIDSIHMPLLRDHHIRILPEATATFIEQLQLK